MARAPFKPSAAELAAAIHKRLPDLLAPGLDVVFCGINPGLYSAAVGCHFGRPGNRFWPTLHRAGFTDRQLSPFEQGSLLPYGCGITNLVDRATRGAAELTAEELARGGKRLRRKLARYRPRALAVLGIEAFRRAFDRPLAVPGRQPEPVETVEVWVLPNPSGANAHYQMEDLVCHFRELRVALHRRAPGRSRVR
jgi:TDG/mug DNA glycosylase family protein